MKILITVDCAAPSMDGPQHLPANTFVDLEVTSAHAVVAAGRGLYVESKDDPSRLKQFTASESRIKAVAGALDSAAKDARAAAAKA